MKLGVLYSGGKDSNYAMYLEKERGNQISCLITIISENKESYMFQTASVGRTAKQAEAMGIPLIRVKTKGVKEEELTDLKRSIERAIREYGIEGLVTGAIASDYQASRIKKICDELRIRCINPLWNIDLEKYWEDLLLKKFKIIIVRVSAEGLGKEWLGVEINRKNYGELRELSKKYHFHLGFEGGEAETFVLWQPMFKKKLRVNKMRTYGEGNTWKLEVGIG